MLGYLKGKVISKNYETNTCVVLSHRIGFEVLFPRNLFDSTFEGQTIELWLHTHVREDILQLFGFPSEDEKNLFRLLLSVSGLGPKTAMNLISEHGAHRLVELIHHKAARDIAKAPGVGKKLAEKLPLELSSKLEKWIWKDKQVPAIKEKSVPSLPSDLQLREDLISALMNLGYAANQAKMVLDKLWEKEELASKDFEFCLKAALRDISSRGVTHHG